MTSLPPRRIREDGSPELRALLESARGDEPTSADVAQVTAKLAAVLPPAVLGTGSVGAGLAKLAWLKGLGGWGLSALVAASAAGLLYTAKRGAPSSEPLAATPAVAVQSAGDAPPAPLGMEPSEADVAAAPDSVAGASAPEAPAVARGAPGVVGASPSPAPTRGTTSRAELELLDRAFAALNSGDPERALQLLASHERTFPGGELGQEREVLRVEALVRLGRFEPARQASERLLREFPGTGYRHKLSRLLADAGVATDWASP